MARDELAERLGPTATSVVKSLNVPAELSADARQSAYLGALIALEKFDATRGVKFVTYAWPFMRKEIIDNVYGNWTAVPGDDGWTPREVPEDAITIQHDAETGQDFIDELDAHMTAEIVCRALGDDDMALLWEHVVDDVPQAEIARRRGTSKMRVSRSIARASAHARSATTSTRSSLT